jgi:hypothetical protein
MIAMASPAPPSRAFVSAAEAGRIAGISQTKLQRLAVLGRVRVELEPGEKPRYSRADVEALRGVEPSSQGVGIANLFEPGIQASPA